MSSLWGRNIQLRKSAVNGSSYSIVDRNVQNHFIERPLLPKTDFLLGTRDEAYYVPNSRG